MNVKSDHLKIHKLTRTPVHSVSWQLICTVNAAGNWSWWEPWRQQGNLKKSHSPAPMKYLWSVFPWFPGGGFNNLFYPCQEALYSQEALIKSCDASQIKLSILLSRLHFPENGGPFKSEVKPWCTSGICKTWLDIHMWMCVEACWGYACIWREGGD